jgi:hypothetical protein
MPVLFALLSLPCAQAQEKQPAEAQTSQPDTLHIPLKVQMVFVEYDGAKIVRSMPYTVMVIASHTDRRDAIASIRVGARVPVAAQQPDGKGPPQYTYLDVGTNIDCWVYKWEDDRYLLSGNVDVSSVYTMNSANQPVEWKPGDPAFGNNPVILHTNGGFAIALHDGQTGEATAATDPITGHIFKVEVTLTLVK